MSSQKNNTMRCFLWNGIPTYEYIVECNGEEIQKLIEHFHANLRYAHDSRTSWEVNGEEKFYYFISMARKRIALLPFLAIVFGGQYNGYGPIGEESEITIDLDEYGLEKFLFR